MSWLMRSRTAVRFGLCAGLLCCLVAGCGGDKTYRVSGKVTFKGQPVPAGRIYFIPDASKGNSGATGYADIKDGSYDTSIKGSRGAKGGPMIVAIEGIDPSAPPDKGEKSAEVTAKTLFPRYEIKVDLPTESTTKDFDVPADAADPKKKGEKEFINP